MKTLCTPVARVLLLGAWLAAAVLVNLARAEQPLPMIEEIIATLKKNEAAIQSMRVQAEAKIRQRTGEDFEGPELKREVRIWFAYDDQGRLRSEKEGGTPGRIGTTDVLQEKQLGTFDGKVARAMWGRTNFDFAYIGPDWTRLYREVDPRNYLDDFANVHLSKRFTEGKHTVVGRESVAIGEQKARELIVVESEPIERDDVSYKNRYLLDPACDDFAVVRSSWIRYGDGPWCEYTNTTAHTLKHDVWGVWLPEHCIYTSYNVPRTAAAKGGPFTISWQYDVKFHDWELNPKLVDADFTFVIPPGVFVNDALTGKSYKQGEVE